MLHGKYIEAVAETIVLYFLTFVEQYFCFLQVIVQVQMALEIKL